MTKLIRRCEGLVNLQCPLDSLNEAQDRGNNQHEYRDPKCVPLHAVAPVIPPLPQRFRGRVVVRLLEDDQAVPPVVETLDLSVLALWSPAVGQAGVNDGLFDVAVL